MDWNVIGENLSAFFNMPIVISIATSLVAFIEVMVIFSKTSLGKKLFSKMNIKAEQAVSMVEEIKTEAQNLLNLKDREIDELGETYEKKLAVVLSENLELEKVIEKIGEVIPNQKVKEVISSFIESRGERAIQISSCIGTSQEFLALKEEAEKAREEAKALYEAKINEADNLLKLLEERARSVLSVAQEGEEDE